MSGDYTINIDIVLAAIQGRSVEWVMINVLDLFVTITVKS